MGKLRETTFADYTFGTLIAVLQGRKLRQQHLRHDHVESRSPRPDTTNVHRASIDQQPRK